MQIFSPALETSPDSERVEILTSTAWHLPAAAGVHEFPAEWMHEPGRAIAIVCPRGFSWRPAFRGVKVYRSGIWKRYRSSFFIGAMIGTAVGPWLGLLAKAVL